MGKPMYAIVGTKKLKTYGNIKGSLMHMMRERPTANSNGKENRILLPPMSFEDIKAEVEQYKGRANSVKILELMLTASPEFFKGKTEEEIKEWETASLLWAQDFFGKEQTLMCVAHHDELTNHLSLLICPSVDGSTLNCRAYTGGRAKMRALWTSYAQAMQRFGLERGKEYSPAKHKDIKEYYADIHQSNRKAQAKKVTEKDLPSPGLKDYTNPKEYAVRMVNALTMVLQKENAHLLQENQELTLELERTQARTAGMRKAGELLKENPAKYAEMEQELTEQKSITATAYDRGYKAGQAEAEKKAVLYKEQAHRYEELERATIQFFDECISKKSSLRFTERAPKYFKKFSAIYPHVTSHVLGMMANKQDMERAIGKDRE